MYINKARVAVFELSQRLSLTADVLPVNLKFIESILKLLRD